MNVAVYLIFWGIILVLWVITEKYEWIIPAFLAEKVQRLPGVKMQRFSQDAVVVDIAATEFMQDDMEKKIYIIRKSKKKIYRPVVMNVKMDPAENWQTDLEKTKQRLEKRFPGLVVNYCPEGGAENNAFLYRD